MARLNAHTYQNRDDAEKRYLQKIDDAAADARKIDATQADLYRQKLIEAKGGGGALLQAEADVLDIDIATLCENVIQRHSERCAHTHEIEIERIKAKADIRVAQNASLMHAIYENFKAAILL
ncbi:hypothetical protein J7J47_03545 [Halomonas sp. ISL-60]|uniref:hypothetical protein n=1 Tax=Halomonas sp. ISL-56 TaxID=2819149 RepID=UPI001BE5FC6D|nr:hypothetical protein [Halomonas sp. ISL-56]MBT2771303.1 hypothetical protein [Halomonas sp. ISL-60]MBT2800660.1 hypothetical protein [Halomonas sp. ISL-56]